MFFVPLALYLIGLIWSGGALEFWWILPFVILGIVWAFREWREPRALLEQIRGRAVGDEVLRTPAGPPDLSAPERAIHLQAVLDQLSGLRHWGLSMSGWWAAASLGGILWSLFVGEFDGTNTVGFVVSAILAIHVFLWSRSGDRPRRDAIAALEIEMGRLADRTGAGGMEEVGE